MMEGSEEVHIEFLLDVWLHGLTFNPGRAEGLSFAAKGPLDDLRISVVPTHPDDDPFGDRRGVTCKIRGSFPASQRERDFIAALLDRRFTPYEGMPFTLPYAKYGQERIRADGQICEGFGLPFEAYPPGLRKLCDHATQVLFEAVARFLKLVIWRLEIDAPPDFIQSHGLYWRVEEGPYHGVGLKRQESTTRSRVGITWDEEDHAALQALWDTGAEEPLAHELLREAKTLSDSSPRSALLVLATALEVGVKSYITRVAPQTRGLIDKMPSPPVFRLFRDYLPLLHDSLGRDAPYWRKLNKLFVDCQGLFEARNDLTHGGSVAMERDRLDKYIETASDLLYLLDVVDGHSWAKQYVWAAHKVLDWPSPQHGRMMVRMTTHDL